MTSFWWWAQGIKALFSMWIPIALAKIYFFVWLQSGAKTLVFTIVGTALKVHMIWKIFSAYLKGLSNYRRVAFFFLKYLFSFQRYWCFSIMQIRSVMTSLFETKNSKILNKLYLWNIEAVFLKRGTINVHHKRNAMTPLMLLPWQQFCHWCCLNKN